MIFNLFGKKKKTQPQGVIATLKSGLQKTRDRLHSAVHSLLGRKTLDEDTRESLLRTLISCDIGPETSAFILEETERGLRSNPDQSADIALKSVLSEILGPSDTPWELPKEKPAVLLFVGVNGSGKTTSIGRIGHHLKENGKKVIMAAGDTFRAAAIEQLQAWGKKTNAPVVAQPQVARSRNSGVGDCHRPRGCRGQ